jgi:PAS domain S-box-containing protein
MAENKGSQNRLADLRRQAEERLRKHPPDQGDDTPEQTADLVHELQVHQIELEMQNEELRLAQEKLEASRARYFDLYDLAPVGYFTLSEEGLILEANLTAATLLGVPRGSLAKRPIARFLFRGDQDIYYLYRKKLFETGAPQAVEIRVMRQGGEPFWARLEATVAQDGENGARICRAVMSDISERVRAESQKEVALEALRRRERDFSTLVENAADMIVRFDADLRHTYCNPAVERQLGVPVQTFLGKTSLEVDGQREQAQFIDRSLRKVLETGQEQQVEQSFPTPSGVKHFQSRIVPEFDPDGHIESLLAITRDITARVQAESQRDATLEQLKAALAEKEVLMREIYHRVKNNIQTLIYLMDMQTEFITDEGSRAMIHELQVRARTMSLVHEQLYQSGNLAQIDFGAYLNDLMANLSRAFWADRPIVWNIDAADALLGVDTAIPCGLIVNELLTNALKYAFPNAQPVVERGETECKIRVEFRAEGDRLTLIVGDNGVGLPPGLDWQTTKSLGLQLINVLARHQLGGQIEVDSRAGTTFKITFTERKKK